MTGFVYFVRPIGMTGPIKIGHSRFPIVRLEQIQSWSPVRLEMIVAIPGDQKLEIAIQSCFADVHLHGEWFEPSDRLQKLMADLVIGEAIRDCFNLSDKKGSLRAHYGPRRHRAEHSFVHPASAA